jgi:hypothetical protein
METDSDVSFSGHADMSELSNGTGAGVLYPGNTAGVFLASVAAHALTNEGVKNAARKNVQDRADKVLGEYAEYIAEIEEGEILSAALVELNGAESYGYTITEYDKTSDQVAWIAHLKPLFIMAQNQRGIMLRIEAHLENPDSPGDFAYQNIIEVVSQPFADEVTPLEHWIHRDRLRLTAEYMLRVSIAWMIEDIEAGPSDLQVEQRTFHYTFGGDKYYERGYQIAGSCEEVVVRSLRGWIRVLPSTKFMECDRSS